MTTLIIPDDVNDATSNRLDISIGDSIDFHSSREDAVVEFAAFDSAGKHVPMAPFGYTLDIHEAKALYALLGEAINKAEA